MTTQNEPELLRNLKPYESVLYEGIDLTGLTVFVLHLLQSGHIPTTFENVTVALFRLFPKKFELIGFPQYPDATRVNRSLLQLRPKYRNWAIGKVVTGFSLTESGLRKVQEVKLALTGDRASHKQVTGSQVASATREDLGKRTVNLMKEIQNIENSTIFEKWKSYKLTEATTLELLTMLEAYSYTSPRAIRNRVSFLSEIAFQFSRDDIIDFLKDIRGRFSSKFEG
ncbi:MAG: hypothetical protein ACRDF4_01335 [Rhabdochlamydiaceae bacterium]